MPVRTIHCSICGKGMSGYDMTERMDKLRRHYKKYHPGRFKQWALKAVETRKSNPYSLLLATLNPPVDVARFPGAEAGLQRFRESHGDAAQMNAQVVDIPGLADGGTWVLQGEEKSVVYCSNAVKGTSKGNHYYEHNVGDGVKRDVIKRRYYSADHPGVELVITIDAQTGKRIDAYKKGWMDESGR